MTWDDLDFWRSQAWQDAQEKLDALDRLGSHYNPERSLIFSSLDLCPLDKVRVVIAGQDPYPSHKHATGVAFSVPKGTAVLPQTSLQILKEYSSDLGHERPGHSDLSSWARQGVLLWNVAPTCGNSPYASHGGWPEWFALSREIFRVLSEKKVVCAFLGARAREFVPFVDESKNFIIKTSHPSPRGSSRSKAPFAGCRLFSRINSHLCEKGLYPINWRLL